MHGKVLVVPCTQLSLSLTDLQISNIVLIGKNCPKSNETHLEGPHVCKNESSPQMTVNKVGLENAKNATK